MNLFYYHFDGEPEPEPIEHQTLERIKSVSSESSPPTPPKIVHEDLDRTRSLE
jgi:hypothetical protein